MVGALQAYLSTLSVPPVRTVTGSYLNLPASSSCILPTIFTFPTYSEPHDFGANPQVVPVIDIYRDKPSLCLSSVNPPMGNPIHPLTGSKREFQHLGDWLGQDVGVVYDTKQKIPSNLPDASFSIVPMPSFGALWQSSLHKALVFQVGASSRKAVQALRGGNVWVSFVKQGTQAYLPDADVADTLTQVSGGWEYRDARAQAIEYYDAAGRVTSISFANGRRLVYAYSNASTPVSVAPVAGLLISVADHFGRTVQFNYEQPAGVLQPRVNRIIDPDGKFVNLSYDGSRNLAAIEWQDLSVRQFRYMQPGLPWALTGVVDERAASHSAFGYDAFGYAISTELAEGVNRHSVGYSVYPRWSVSESFDQPNNVVVRTHTWQLPEGTVVQLPLGASSSLDAVSVLGAPRLAQQGQPAGAGCSASTRYAAFDANGNLSSEDDFNGNRTCLVFDVQRNLETTRVEGLAATTN